MIATEMNTFDRKTIEYLVFQSLLYNDHPCPHAESKNIVKKSTYGPPQTFPIKGSYVTITHLGDDKYVWTSQDIKPEQVIPKFNKLLLLTT